MIQEVRISTSDGVFSSHATISQNNEKAVEHFKGMNVPVLRVISRIKNNSDIDFKVDGYYVGGKFSEMSKVEFRNYLKEHDLLIG